MYLESGQCSCDDLGASVKRESNMAVKQGTVLIQNVDDFYAWTTQECGNKVKNVYHSQENYNEAKSILDSKAKCQMQRSGRDFNASSCCNILMEIRPPKAAGKTYRIFQIDKAVEKAITEKFHEYSSSFWKIYQTQNSPDIRNIRPCTKTLNESGAGFDPCTFSSVVKSPQNLIKTCFEIRLPSIFKMLIYLTIIFMLFRQKRLQLFR